MIVSLRVFVEGGKGMAKKKIKGKGKADPVVTGGKSGKKKGGKKK